MDKLNENVGLIVVIACAVLILLSVIVILMLASLKKKLAVQRLKFIGQFSADPVTRRMVADITVSNRSLNDITLAELGLRNGKVNFNYTDLYKYQNGLTRDAAVVVGQRGALRLVLTAEDLARVLIQDERGKIVLKKISVYAMDTTGISYEGKISDVKKLLVQISKSGVDYLPPAVPVKAPPAAPMPAKPPVPPAPPAEKAKKAPAEEKPHRRPAPEPELPPQEAYDAPMEMPMESSMEPGYGSYGYAEPAEGWGEFPQEDEYFDGGAPMSVDFENLE